MTWTDAPGDNEQLPMNCVGFYEAFAFCLWDGGRLPTEAEWESVAAGGEENRLYPWGSTAPGADAMHAVHGCYYDGVDTCDGLVDIAPVGSAPMGNGRSS